MRTILRNRSIGHASLTPTVLLLLATIGLTPPSSAQDKGVPNESSVPVFARTSGGPDSFGYFFLDEEEFDCNPGFVDISATGTPVTFTPSSGFAADDDGGAALPLMEPFEFYGLFFADSASSTSVVMSSNGYLAFADGLFEESGGDFSNDCPLPAVPDNPPSTPLRIMPFHDDLSGQGTGSAFWQYFPLCPREQDIGLGTGSCTIYQWTDWSTFGGGDTFTFQIILYHDIFAIVFELPQSTPDDGMSATVGIQSQAADHALTFQCDAGTAIAPKTVCIYAPGTAFPSGIVGIPTTGLRGLILLIALLAISAVAVVRRQKVESP